MKICIKCKIEKEDINFHKDIRMKNGLRSDCKDCVKIYCIKNKEIRKKNNIKFREINKDYIIKYRKEHYQINKERILKQTKLYTNNKLKTDSLFKLSVYIRNLIGYSIRKKEYTKNLKSHKILGCSIEEFKEHLEKQFTEGMNWENAGKWHLDHIYPVSLATDEKHLIQLNHYTNFQPLWAIDNIRKSNKI